MKKLISLALILAMILTVPASLAFAEGEKTVITAMCWNTGQGWGNKLDKYLAEHPELNMEVEYVIGGEGPMDVAAAMRLLIAANNQDEMPDLIFWSYQQLTEFAEVDGLLLDLGPYMTPYEDDIIDAVQDLISVDGTYLGFPLEMKSKVWFYRKDVFAEAGIVPEEVKTIDELIEAGKKIQEIYPEAYLENYAVPMADYDLMMVATGLDARISDENGEYVIGSDPGFHKALEYFKKMRDSGVASSTIAEWSADWDSSFTDNTMVSQLIGAWFKSGLARRGEAGKWGAALWPEEIRYGSDTGSAVMSILAGGEHAEALAEILEYVYWDTENAADDFFMDDKTYPPFIKSARELINYEEQPGSFWEESVVPNELDSYEYLRVYPYTISTGKELLIINQFLNEYLSGTMELEEALQACEDDLKMQVGNSLNPY